MAHTVREQPDESLSSRGGQENHRRVTLQDVARAAGVNVSTASDALKGTGRVAEATREKVRRIAAEHKYIPNMAARALVTGRTGMVAVVSGPLDQHYYADLVYLLETQLAVQSYRTLLLHSRQEVHDLITATGSAAVDGVIAIDMYHIVDEFLRADNKVQPCVFIGTYSPPSVDHVTVDLSFAVEEALTVMLVQKRRRIAYLVDSEPMASRTEVRAGTYLSVVERARQKPEIINLLTESRLVRQQFREYIRTHGCPDGLLCQNDETAIYAYRALLDMGYRVPEDVLLVGCDGLHYLEYFETPISTIVQPMKEICALAWQFLQKRIADPSLPIQKAKVGAHLIQRESLGALPPSRRRNQ
ncbi:catabolite control protein A [Abditibacteriota bacterium]|nr:catabolite control protein A [Abditibacteriota bacterium]